MTGIAVMFTQTATVEPAAGQSGYGDVFGAPFTVSCFIDDEVHTVTTGPQQETVSSGRVFAALEWADSIPVGSRVTFWSDREALVVAVSRHDTGGFLTAVEHVELHLS